MNQTVVMVRDVEAGGRGAVGGELLERAGNLKLLVDHLQRRRDGWEAREEGYSGGGSMLIFKDLRRILMYKL